MGIENTKVPSYHVCLTLVNSSRGDYRGTGFGDVKHRIFLQWILFFLFFLFSVDLSVKGEDENKQILKEGKCRSH